MKIVVPAKAGTQAESAGGTLAIGARTDGAPMARGPRFRGDDDRWLHLKVRRLESCRGLAEELL